MKELPITEFGNSLLRQSATRMSADDIKSEKTKSLIKRMKFTLTNKKRGVGLAAPQVGRDLALAVILIQPTKHRPEVSPLELTLINPEIPSSSSRKIQMWEGCLSCGPSPLFAKVPRYKTVEVRYHDETGKLQKQKYEGLAAQVIQHEVDHLNGILFVDRVKDPKTFMTLKEYKKHVINVTKH
jgi:peptide deformylase